MNQLPELPQKIKTIVSHGDGDGLACAAIALRRFPNAKLVFSEPTIIKETIKKIEKPALVLDIADTPQEENIYIIDHHPCPPGPPSCVELMQHWPESTPYIVQLGQASDQAPVDLPGNVRKDAKMLYLLLGSCGPEEGDKLRSLIVRGLAAGKKICDMPNIVKLVEQRRSRVERLIKDSVEEAGKRAETYKDAVIVIYPNVPKGYAGIVADSLKNRAFKIFLIWSTNADTTVVTIRCQIGNATQLIKKIKEVDKKFISGGGHARSASFSTKSKPEEVAKIIKEML